MDVQRPGYGYTLDERSRARFASFAHAVAALHHQLRQRIADEEGDGGFFELLCRVSPRYLTMLPTLRADHSRLLAAMAGLRQKIRAASHRDYLQLVLEAAALLTAIEEHDALERALWRDALASR